MLMDGSEILERIGRNFWIYGVSSRLCREMGIIGDFLIVDLKWVDVLKALIYGEILKISDDF